MARAYKSLPEPILERARALLAQGHKIRGISNELQISYYLLRIAIDPDYRAYHRQAARDCYLKRHRKKIGFHRNEPQMPRTTHGFGHAFIGEAVQRVDVPERVELERQRNAEYEPETITAAFCGDPPPWRSALAKRRSP